MRVPLSIESYKMISRMVFKPESAICEYCGKKFPPARNGQRFCSNKCRKANYWYQVRMKNGTSSKKQ